MKEVYIISAVRTPLGSFGGKLSGLTAVELGAQAIKGALGRAQVTPEQVDEVIMGNVLSANLGQAPARQAAIGAGIGYHVPCTTVNKVCASGMKSVMFAAQSIMTGQSDIIVAGGMESMSNVPYYIPKARFGYKFGNGEFVDGLAKDGLHEVYYNFPMGNCADNTAKEKNISREAQDEYAIQSYRRAAEAWKAQAFQDEVIPVTFKSRKGESITVDEDEEYQNVLFEKIPSLRPVFDKEGTVTAANASTMNDGAAALVLMSKEKAEALGLQPVAKILGFADAATDPIWFTTAPALAIPKALKNAGIQAEAVDYYEINEAFSAVALANQQELNIPNDRLNVFGGAVSLGHPLGASGARIMATLHSVLRQKGGKIGVAGICNGGGGASAMVIENLR
ncbi:acetyl-CoA C-acyltransferase [Echinicola vietnamensis]|uniref:Acetyl-CoA acetyltransferase n=1 Tax=Echinicola vietnamensis (strain DSM 17526 / LMG 23754 / KMM 6221) TaxID=926556 RepID=L0G303_ECHVK|nr:acetyl-CoA C-acyltransferase [Echinicola vietnamensis]AGA79917.1 acetyl-CoA acetyltransferase [Echinicola vietnamensis DSM 17526]